MKNINTFLGTPSLSLFTQSVRIAASVFTLTLCLVGEELEADDIYVYKLG